MISAGRGKCRTRRCGDSGEDAIKICGCLVRWRNLRKRQDRTGQRVCEEARARGWAGGVYCSRLPLTCLIGRFRVKEAFQILLSGAIMKLGSAFFSCLSYCSDLKMYSSGARSMAVRGLWL